MKSESSGARKGIADVRVHACLYFVQPSGHTLKPLDIEVMKHLGTRVNLIPVVAKADTLTPKICPSLKSVFATASRHTTSTTICLLLTRR
ncbi:hypothetical protein BASA60_001287 [Batrachochytrium salamandrivorans]|nr:hypothetical protein BASA60_001287 [Batrachochytrium salamandrivorans]